MNACLPTIRLDDDGVTILSGQRPLVDEAAALRQGDERPDDAPELRRGDEARERRADELLPREPQDVTRRRVRVSTDPGQIADEDRLAGLFEQSAPAFLGRGHRGARLLGDPPSGFFIHAPFAFDLLTPASLRRLVQRATEIGHFSHRAVPHGNRRLEIAAASRRRERGERGRDAATEPQAQTRSDADEQQEQPEGRLRSREAGFDAPV
jgi:hypothetical protein